MSSLRAMALCRLRNNECEGRIADGDGKLEGDGIEEPSSS